MIKSLLIANRGEIARRIIRTARSLGVRTIAVHSDVDAKLPFVREADEAVCIGPAPARESYLDQAKILAAACETGAEAIHPGYGFLSENADFAQAVIDAGLIWVGAPPAAIRAMGLKDAAKALMTKAGVPVTPGYLGEDQSPGHLQAEADAIGYPVLIKAVAGGGGKGMRRVEAAAGFADALGSCRREAASSFGDDRVLIEKYIINPRHIEVQVFGDTHGNVVHLFERDCSLQRRHQKVIEEAPAPGMDEATRAAICAAAVKAANAVDYVGAGTIEFIADASDGLRADRIWFMEMNTRLQVEHPVTEEITGQDLVEWQLRVASGEPLPKKQDELVIDGWAIEARLYAEDPAKGFLPSIGKLDWLELPEELRIESGVEQGDVISPYYDPMIAKLVAKGATRGEAIDRLLDGCRQIAVAPVKTNAWFIARLLDRPEYREGAVTTAFIGDHPELAEVPRPSPEMLEQAAYQAVYNDEFAGTFPRPGDDSRFICNIGFRLNAARTRQVWLSVDGERVAVDFRDDDPAFRAYWSNPRHRMMGWSQTATMFVDGAAFVTAPYRPVAGAGGSVADGFMLAPMPGRIVSVEVAQGASVTAGQKLVVLEAMKMEQALVAPFDGVVAELKVEAGAQVPEGTLLVRIDKTEA